MDMAWFCTSLGISKIFVCQLNRLLFTPKHRLTILLRRAENRFGVTQEMTDVVAMRKEEARVNDAVRWLRWTRSGLT